MLDVRYDAAVARIALDRPEVHNAFDGEMVARLTGVFEDLGQQDDVRVIVLSGNGPSFSAGGDLNWMRRTIDFSIDENLADARRLAGMFHTIAACPKPVVARVHGAALGGGAGLVAVADIAIAMETAVFGFTEVRLGIVPAVISPWVVARIGAGRAREYLLTGERFSAATASAIGLVHRVVGSSDALDAEVGTTTRDLLAAGPLAIARTKSLIWEAVAGSPDSAVGWSARALAEARTSDEGQAGMAAFLERRKPPWARQ
jgi:methylglutaconyl-CoA hydratase